MRTIALSELYKMDYSVTRVLAMRQHWEDGNTWSTPESGRTDSGLMYFFGCALDYDAGAGGTFGAEKGEISYVAHQSRYTCRFKDCGPASADRKNATNYLINFTLTDASGEPFRLSDSVQIFRPRNSAYYADCFGQMIALTQKGDAPPARIKALLYNLLTDISLELRKESFVSRRFYSIYNAIVYLEHNYVDNISISELAGMSHVSESCFRRLFREYCGMPPLAYIQRLKLSKARRYLESGVLTVSETAAAVGIDDPCYFSRLYKQKTGFSPSESFKKSGVKRG